LDFLRECTEAGFFDETFLPERLLTMLCDVCKAQTASVFLTQIVDGKIQKVNLCDPCSKEKGVTDPTGFALADMLFGMGAAQQIGANLGPEGARCPQCGFTQAEFKKTGRLGCSVCYVTFAEPLKELLKGMHKGLRHIGKCPERLRLTQERDSALRQFHDELRAAVVEEKYEEAAALRDKIRALELSGGTKGD
jgi:protein arginine kinase activator